jgi:hypothetical protein
MPAVGGGLPLGGAALQHLPHPTAAQQLQQPQPAQAS